VRLRGVSYVVGTGPLEAALHDMRAIREDLHCNAVMLIGTDTEFQIHVARYALEIGLDVYIRPYLADEPPSAILEHLASTAAAAEQLRTTYPGRVTLLLGSEFSLTSRGMVPGHVVFVRLQFLIRPWLRRLFDHRITKRLHRLLAEALSTARRHFKGPITYAAGRWESVDWSGFDLVGVNLYRSGANSGAYESRLHAIVQEAGKPVVITEFGCGAFLGAERRGPGSFRIVNWFAEPPRIRESNTRDEETQARYLAELIELYDAAGVYGCFVYTFVSPGFPHNSDPALDLDMAGFGLVKTDPDQPTQWEPKLAFRKVAERYQRLQEVG
jgi:hypothetical protein